MRSTETIEEMEERHPPLNSRQMRHSRQIHHLLHATRREHGKTRGAGSHHIAMVAKYGKGVRSHRAGRHVEHCRQ